MERRKANIKQRGESKMKKYFEKIDPPTNTNKFWEISLKTKKVVTKYGRIGNKPTETENEFSSKEEAQNYAEKKIREKQAKGYEQVS